MITIVQKKCNKINCMNLIPFNETYCEEHQYIKEQSKQNYQKKRYKRDYKLIKFYNSSQWKSTRHSVMLRDNGLCRYCLHHDTVTRAEVVDHYYPIRDYYEKRLENGNLYACCIKCNTKKEKDENRLRNNEITTEEFRNRWQIGY